MAHYSPIHRHYLVLEPVQDWVSLAQMQMLVMLARRPHWKMASWRKRWQLVVVVADDTGSGEAKAKEKLRLLEYYAHRTLFGRTLES